MEKLLDYLNSQRPGDLLSVSELAPLLAACWHQIEGGNAGGMEPYKLHGRMESVRWGPPLLTFTIERHGGTVLGSSRAELQVWQINLNTRSATCESRGYRQLKPAKKKLDVKAIAEDVAELIDSGREDSRLQRNPDGTVRVLIGNIFPEGSAVKQTVADRRKRFRTHLCHLLVARGWQVVRSNMYQKPSNTIDL